MATMASKARLVQSVARRAFSNRLKGQAPLVIQTHAHSTSAQPVHSQQSPSSEDLIQLEHKYSAHK